MMEGDAYSSERPLLILSHPSCLAGCQLNEILLDLQLFSKSRLIGASDR